MITAILSVLLLQAPDPIAAEAKFRALLDRVERAGLSVPELPEGARELEGLLTPALPKDLRDRYTVVRAQAVVLSTLHAHFIKNKGAALEVWATGRAVTGKIVDVTKRTVQITRPEGTQDFGYSELDADWVLGAIRETFPKDGDAPLLRGLWLAKGAKWDAAFLALGGVTTDHPLAAEARKRGLDVAVAGFDAIVRGRRWAESIARLEALDKLAPDDARLKTARDKLLDAMVETGKEHCRKKSKGPMQEIIDLITKHFPAGADRIEDIREAGRWIKITDPKKFGVAAVKGPPWLLEPKEGDSAFTGWLKESAEKYEGIAAVVRIPKGEETMGGLLWDDRAHIVSISGKTSTVGVYRGNRGEMLPNVFSKDIALEGRHHLSARFRNGSFVVQYNGAEIYRHEGKADGFEVLGLNAHKGKAWFDEVWLLKKE